MATAKDFRASCWSHHQLAIEAAPPSGRFGDLVPFTLITTSGSRALKSDTAWAAVVVAGAVLLLVGVQVRTRVEAPSPPSTPVERELQPAGVL